MVVPRCHGKGAIRCSPLDRRGLGAFLGTTRRSRGYIFLKDRLLELFRGHFCGFGALFGEQPCWIGSIWGAVFIDCSCCQALSFLA